MVILPLAAPGLFTTAILAFIALERVPARPAVRHREDRRSPSPSPVHRRPAAPGALHRRHGGGDVVTVPLIIMVLLFQRAIVAGLTAGGVKGEPGSEVERGEALQPRRRHRRSSAGPRPAAGDADGHPRLLRGHGAGADRGPGGARGSGGLRRRRPGGAPRCCSDSSSGGAPQEHEAARHGHDLRRRTGGGRLRGHGLPRPARAGPVSPQTRARVVRAAQQLHYVASPTATSLASGRTRGSAVVVPFLTRWFFAEVISRIEKALRDEDYHVLLLDLESDPSTGGCRLTETMLSKRVDGVILLDIPGAQERDLLDRLGLPVVTVGNQSAAGRRCGSTTARPWRWRSSSAVASGTATRLVGPCRVRRPPPDAVRTAERVQRVLAQPRPGPTGPSGCCECDWSAPVRPGGDPALRRLRRPTCVVAASDEMAFGVMTAARRPASDVPGGRLRRRYRRQRPGPGCST